MDSSGNIAIIRPAQNHQISLLKNDDFKMLTSSKGLGMLRLVGSLISWKDRIFMPNVIANAIVASIKRTHL